jgi:DNA-binding MarR family transcriptional regulator
VISPRNAAARFAPARAGARPPGWRSRSECLAGRTLLAVARQRRELDFPRCQLVLEHLDAAAALQTALRRALGEFGLSELQFGVLIVLFALDPASLAPADLADYTAVSRAAITDALDRLERRQWIVRTRDASDRRVHHVTLTAAGRRVADQAMMAFLRAAGHAARLLEPAVPTDLLHAFRRLKIGAGEPTHSHSRIS